MPRRPHLNPPEPRLCNGATTLCCYVGKKRFTFGNAAKRASWEKYQKFVSDFLHEKLTLPDSSAGGDILPPGALNDSYRIPEKTDVPVPASYLVADLIAAFLNYIEREVPKDQYDRYRQSAKWVMESGYGDCPVDEFTPKKLKDVRQRMIDSKRMCREQVNALKNKIVRMFRWGVEEEMVGNPSVPAALQAVENIRKGKGGTFDHPDTKAVPDDVIKRTLPGMPPTVAAMVLIQRLTAMRPNEVFNMRVGDIDQNRKNGLWYYEPGAYKTRQFVGNIQFPLGKPEQELIAPYLAGKKPDAAVFSPRTAMEERNAEKRANRKTKLTPSQKARDKQRAKKPRKIAEFYNRISYRKAIQYAIDAVNRELPDGEKVPQWTPYRIRNRVATEIETKIGLDEAQAQLGHTSANMTKRYSDAQLAIRERLALERKNPFTE
jgi:integrase